MSNKRHFLLTAMIVAGSTGIAAAADWKALPTEAPAPKDNPTTEAKVELGKMLYFDPRLSSTGTVSCNSCHNVMLGGEDNRHGSMGVHGQVGGRSAPTVWNSAFNSVQFWDGRAPSLEEQAKGPVTNPIEMGMSSWDEAAARIQKIPSYKPHFEEAFGSDEISSDSIAKAIAAYERTLITPNSPYDQYVNGKKDAMNEQQVRGMNLFAEVGCTSCHSGAAFNGPSMPEGAGFFMKFPSFSDQKLVGEYDFSKDLGRADVTGKESDKHLWKVPTLRNVAITAPYFHNGSVKDLSEAVHVMAKLQLNKELSKEQVADITAFLNSLTGEFPEQTLPRLPETPSTSFDVKSKQGDDSSADARSSAQHEKKS